MKGSQIGNLVSKLEAKTVLYSEMEGKVLSDYSVFVIDTIGLLSKIYSYADISYVGGAMGNTGLHNILEPAVFGVPIIIGKEYSKFPEAFDMIENGGLISIKNYDELQSTLNNIIDHPSERKRLGTANAHFITQNKGAVIQILNYIRI
jgi:3-deoxy-D-manno-octulosonic-acid transferase